MDWPNATGVNGSIIVNRGALGDNRLQGVFDGTKRRIRQR